MTETNDGRDGCRSITDSPGTSSPGGVPIPRVGWRGSRGRCRWNIGVCGSSGSGSACRVLSGRAARTNLGLAGQIDGHTEGFRRLLGRMEARGILRGDEIPPALGLAEKSPDRLQLVLRRSGPARFRRRAVGRQKSLGSASLEVHGRVLDGFHPGLDLPLAPAVTRRAGGRHVQ